MLCFSERSRSLPLFNREGDWSVGGFLGTRGEKGSSSSIYSTLLPMFIRGELIGVSKAASNHAITSLGLTVPPLVLPRDYEGWV